MRISDWSSDVCSSDLLAQLGAGARRLVILLGSLRHRTRTLLRGRRLSRRGHRSHRSLARHLRGNRRSVGSSLRRALARLGFLGLAANPLLGSTLGLLGAPLGLFRLALLAGRPLPARPDDQNTEIHTL